MAAQCGILFIGPCNRDAPRVAALRSLGFRVDESPDLPLTDELASYQAVVVRVVPNCPLTMIGARLRAKPHFGRRVLMALVHDAVSDRDRREAMLCGFDQTLTDSCTAREIAAHVLHILRRYPEYRCLLRAPNGRRKAA